MKGFGIKKTLLVLLLTAASRPIFALDFNENGYGSIADYLSEAFGLDDNTGLTAFPVLNVPMGGRSEGMATAFISVADDVSFIEWNPAGSSVLGRSELAFFHNNWIADTKIEGAVYAFRIREMGLAAAGKWLYTPFTEYNMFGERASSGYYSEAVGILNISYNFLSGYYFSGISAGINLKGAFRFVPDFADKTTGNILSGSGRSQSTGAVMADVGMLTRFNFLKFYNSREKNTSAAIVIRNLGPPSMGEPMPTVATAGLSYRPFRPLLLSFDFSFPVNLMDPALSEKPYWAAGISVDITRFLSMRTGFMAKSGSSRFSIGSAIILNNIAIDINYTLDLLTQFQPLNRVSLGVRFNFGDQGRGEKALRVDELYMQGLNAYARGSNEEARYYWEEALELNPRFDPAREGIAILDHSDSVERRIREMQQLDF